MSNTDSKIKQNEDNEEVVVEKEQPKKNVKKPVKISDETLIKCKSTCPNLFFGTKDDSKFEWDGIGDTQDLSFRELREMKATQQKFFTDQWIIILGVADAEDVEISAEEIYKSLGISRHYENIVDVAKIHEIIKWSDGEIKEKIKMMSAGAQENLAVALIASIKNKRLDSLSKINIFEDALGCELIKK